MLRRRKRRKPKLEPIPWKYYNPNPLQRDGSDCAVRALAGAMDVSWDNAYAHLVEAGAEIKDVPHNNAVIYTVLHEEGFRCIPVTGGKTIRDLHITKPAVLEMDGHTAYYDGEMINDTSDQTDTPILAYWVYGG